jgi:hypothetical protein
MYPFLRHTVAISLAVIFGPLTSGYPVVLALCGSNDGPPMLCQMAACEDDVPTGSSITSPACCISHVVADGVSKTFVKPHQPSLDIVAIPVESSERSMLRDPDVRSLDRLQLDPAVHASPLYISHQSLLI